MAEVTPVMFRADVTFRAFEPLVTSASVVSVCSAFRLAFRAYVERLPFEHDDPLTETSWHNSTSVVTPPLKLSPLLSAVLALQRRGDDVQFVWAS